MGLHKDYDDDNYHTFDPNYEEYENMAELSHKKRVRQALEERLERKRLKHELEDYEGELDDEFNWDR